MHPPTASERFVQALLRLDPPPAPLVAGRIAVLGDLHLARPGSPACATLSPAQLDRLLTTLREESDTVLFNGDLFDLERGPRPWRQAAELATLAPVHAEYLERLRAHDARCIFGNHDRVLGSAWGAAEAVDVQTPLGVVRIEHGDRFNAPIKRVRAFASAVTWASGRVQGPRTAPVYRAMKLAERVLAGEPEREDAAGAVERNAAAWLAAQRTNAPIAMVIGHTHRRRAEQVGTRWLLNHGATMHAPRAVIVDATGPSLAWRWCGEALPAP